LDLYAEHNQRVSVRARHGSGPPPQRKLQDHYKPERIGGRRAKTGAWPAVTTRHFTAKRSFCMNWDRIEGNWKQFSGKVKEKWGKLTDDDLDVVNGKREQLEGKIQERYGYGKDQVKKELDDWSSTL
jgi:uncharacterized protein YjbJ (UPF0337 family)